MKSRLLHQDGETRTYLLVMDAGDEACAEITAFARDRGIRGATVTAIGAVDEATLGVFAAELGGFWLKHFDEQLEIASFIGDIATGSEGPTLHAHAVLGGRDCVAYAGHAEALHVNPTMEVVLTESPAHLVKRLDPSSGLAVIAIDETRADDVPSESRTTPPVPRGINHIGLTVPDLEAATRFLVDAFGAKVAYDGLLRSDPPRSGAEVEAQLGLPPGARIIVQRMIVIGTGPGLEVFEVETDERQGPAGLADIGWGHVALLVDDIDASLARAVEAGGETLDEPHGNSRHEDTPGNASIYVRAPWGSIFELQSLPNGHWYGPGSETEVWTP